jgi:hypothetical protein
MTTSNCQNAFSILITSALSCHLISMCQASTKFLDRLLCFEHDARFGAHRAKASSNPMLAAQPF